MQISQLLGNIKSAMGIADRDDSDLDADMKRVLDAHADLGAKPLSQLSVEEARTQPSLADAVDKIRALDAAFAVRPQLEVRDFMIAGASGSIPARLYQPADAKDGAALPVVVYFHGGGFVIADLETYDATPRAMAHLANAIVISVHYRQAPEHPLPAAHDDAFAAWQWVLANATQLGGDPANVAIMGESAGGNLAINTSIRARDAGIQMPVHQVLVYPFVSTDMETPSYHEHRNAKPLDKAGMQWFADKVVAGEVGKDSPLLNVVDADLSRLPAATIITAQVDPLRSEGETLAIRLQAESPRSVLRNFDGVTHEFFGMGDVVSRAREAQQFAAERLNEAFKRNLH
ncbi:alpha/beta hydrolase [Uliginosibacterium sp. H1]|uniref:alpha/beta hydrolase n=1 Tax=Uliginosibacterium sp. H1 TaxID=3114757 RepID=UPI002E17A816|nr:alpha/beta hydrolase [Uliginosibacterium sp. H1]